MEVRLAVWERSVGDGAACVRNLVSSKSTAGCVHQITIDGIDGRAVCGWKYPERVHMLFCLTARCVSVLLSGVRGVLAFFVH